MINQQSLLAAKQAVFHKEFCRPLYDSYGFSRIPETVKSLFNGKHGKGLPPDVLGQDKEQYDLVILFLIDGFGWRFFEKYSDRYPFLKRFFDKGTVSKIISQFPSTTAAHVTTINTGLPVGMSGVYEWFYYEPKVDEVIAPLLFSIAGDKTLDTLKKTKLPLSDFYPSHTLYEDLQKEGITSYVMQNEVIAHSCYSHAMFKGAKNFPYMTLQEGLENLVSLCKAKQEEQEKIYCYFYFGDIDAMGHRHGIDSPEFDDAVHRCWTSMEEFFWNRMHGLQKKIACAFTADHGMVGVDPSETYYLNEELPQIKDMIKKNRRGKLIAPAGSCRDFFLHIRDDKMDEAERLLNKHLSSKAMIVRTEHLIEQGFFGNSVSDVFLGRVGNLVLLPYDNHGIWWHEKGRFAQHFYAVHGGLTRDEMESIFLFQKLS